MEIVKATRKYIDDVTGLFDEYRKFYGQESDVKGAEDFLTGLITSNQSVIFLALSDNKEPAGFVQLYPYFTSVGMQRAWILNDLFVKEEFRKQGVAQKLIEMTKNFCANTDAKYIMLETHK